VVILVTLVFQGLTLPLIIKWVNIKDTEDFPPDEEQDAAIHLRLMHVALKELNEKYAVEMKENELVGFLKDKLESDITIVDQRLASMECDATQQAEIDLYNKVLIHLYTIQRKELYKMRKEKIYSDEEIRKHESQLDLDETKITQIQH
jgi:CPA1 family monovalent cation:H+ antiporter